MERRSFVGMLGAAGSFVPAGLAAGERRTQFYTLEQLFCKNGTQMPRIHEFMSKAMLPALEKVHSGPKICLEALVAPHMPQFAAILGFESLDQMQAVHAKLDSDAGLMKAHAEFENGPEPPFEHQANTLLAATAYSPEIAAPSANAPARIFELRTYHSPTRRQLRALHERFAGPEIRIFRRCGIHPVLYSSTIFGTNIPNLTYLIPFENLAEREKAWNAFAADPEWIKVRKESIDAYGQISSVMQISLYKATPYSPVR